MATKSFLKTVNLHGRKQCQDFIRAVEQSQHARVEQTSCITDLRFVKARDLTPEQIRKIFCEKKAVEDVL